MNTYLILDIETIPDSDLWTPEAKLPERLKLEKGPSKADLEFLNVVIDRSDDDLRLLHPLDIAKAHDIAVRAGGLQNGALADRLAPFLPLPEIEKSEFAPHHAHKVAVIGYVWLDSNFLLKKMGARQLNPDLGNEVEVLSKWNDFMNEHRPTIVSWYGRGFDLPVLMLRSFKAGIPMPWYFSDKDYRYRYSETKHSDLCDAMADYGSVRSLKLDAIAKLVGLPGKHGGNDGGDPIDGSQVAEMVARGKIDTVADYCVSDVAQTAFVFLRWLLLKGRLSLDGYRASCASLLADVRENPATARSLAPLVDEKSLMLNLSPSSQK